MESILVVINKKITTLRNNTAPKKRITRNITTTQAFHQITPTIYTIFFLNYTVNYVY